MNPFTVETHGNPKAELTKKNRTVFVDFTEYYYGNWGYMPDLPARDDAEDISGNSIANPSYKILYSKHGYRV